MDNVLGFISLIFFLLGTGTGYIMSLKYNHRDEPEVIITEPVDVNNDIETGLNQTIYNDYFGSGIRRSASVI